MLKKKEVLKIEIEKNIHMFQCPICSSDCFLDNYSLVCNNKHTFDFSNKGNVVLCKTSRLKDNIIYDLNLFRNRRKFIKSGFYDKLHNKIKNIIINKKNNKIILDMGSGEGTHDVIIAKNINCEAIIGIDLSKSAALLGGDFIGENYIPVIGDLNNVPIKNESVDIILNILSPSNENEMNRILKSDGIIIKVTPKKDYLKELRELLKLEDYKNESVIEKNITNNYEILEKIEINDSYNLSESQFNNLIEMTPMVKFKDVNGIINKITIALNIFVLKPKNRGADYDF